MSPSPSPIATRADASIPHAPVTSRAKETPQRSKTSALLGNGKNKPNIPAPGGFGYSNRHSAHHPGPSPLRQQRASFEAPVLAVSSAQPPVHPIRAAPNQYVQPSVMSQSKAYDQYIQHPPREVSDVEHRRDQPATRSLSTSDSLRTELLRGQQQTGIHDLPEIQQTAGSPSSSEVASINHDVKVKLEPDQDGFTGVGYIARQLRDDQVQIQQLVSVKSPSRNWLMIFTGSKEGPDRRSAS